MDQYNVISNNPGTVIIKHTDPWHGSFYLKDDLTFTPHRDHASKFYLLKSDDNRETSITNGDRVSINIDNRSLIVHGSNLSFEKREPISVTTFLIVNGTNDNDPIIFNTPLFLIIDKNTKQALKYVWNLDLNNILDAGLASFKENNRPTLVISSYDNLPERDINTFKFSLEHSDSITSTNITHTNTLAHTNTVLFSDNYKGSIIIVLLLIILVICALVGKY